MRLALHAARVLHGLRQFYWRVFRPVTLGVAAIVLDDNQHVLLIRNSYRSGWHLPGGGVKRGETVSRAVVREVGEETGVRAAEESCEVWGIFSNFSEHNYDHVVVFILRHCDFAALRHSSFEISEVKAFPLDRLPHDMGAGSLRRIEEFRQGAPSTRVW